MGQGQQVSRAPTHLILVKHALPQVDPTIPASRWVLGGEGRHRCVPLARVLEAYHPTIVVSSSEPKAVEAGQLLADHLGVAHETAEGLHEHEREHAGFLAKEAFEAAVCQFFAQPDTLVFGQETARQAQTRFVAAVQRVLACRPDETVAIVTHGTVIALFAAQVGRAEPFALWQALGLPSFIVFSLPSYAIVDVQTKFSTA